MACVPTCPKYRTSQFAYAIRPAWHVLTKDLMSMNLEHVKENTAIARIHWYDSIDSTNSAALEQASRYEELPELFITDNQLAGRGRRGAQWWSSEGALTFSLLIKKPQLASHEASLISLAVGLALCRATSHFLPLNAVQLKWPNDLFVDGHKACGILVESPSQATELVVIGVGLNVNNSLEDAPDELSSIGTSLRQALGRPADAHLDRTEVLIACLNQIFTSLADLAKNSARVMAEVNQRSFLNKRQVRIESPGSTLEGTCLGIAADGAIILDTVDGQIPLYGGAVTWFSR